MNKKTKIIATIGPSDNTKEVILELIKSGVNIFRLNFSWDNHTKHKEIIDTIREAEKELSEPVEIMQDLSGPRVQIGGEHKFGGEENGEVITEKDKNDLIFGVENNVDYIAQSFVGKKEDMEELKNLVQRANGNQKIIAKIERKEAYKNIDSIISVSDGIMVARGDLGNEFELEKIPFIQHDMIEKANKANKMVIVATQMMLSMTENKIPTRAEVTDVAYAIIDGADAVMLSEESAKGKYPIETVQMMNRIAKEAESNFNNIKID